jgi:hypothetical protein
MSLELSGNFSSIISKSFIILNILLTLNLARRKASMYTGQQSRKTMTDIRASEWYSNTRSQCLGSHDPSLRLPILHNKSIQCDITTYLDDSVRCSIFTVHLTHAFTGKCWSRHNALHSAEGCSRLAGRGGQRLVKDRVKGNNRVLPQARYTNIRSLQKEDTGVKGKIMHSALFICSLFKEALSVTQTMWREMIVR